MASDLWHSRWDIGFPLIFHSKSVLHIITYLPYLISLISGDCHQQDGMMAAKREAHETVYVHAFAHSVDAVQFTYGHAPLNDRDTF